MNSFGRIFRISLFGESHGEGVGIAVDGCPAGLRLAAEDFSGDLKRRQSGARGTTGRQEADHPLIWSGLRKQTTTGMPIMIFIKNKNVRSRDYDPLRYFPRPGHADFVAWHKFGGFHDSRGGGQFSGRMTVAFVAAGVIAKKILRKVRIRAALIEVGGSRDITKTVNQALREGDSIGGLVECRAEGIPVGLGEPFFDTAESLLSHLVFAIPGVKGIEFGSGFACSRMTGSQCNDVILSRSGRTKTNHAGGIHGGLTNGNELVFRVAFKPPASIPKEQDTIHVLTGKSAKIRIRGRHDACLALRTPVIVEAVTAIVLADLMLLEQKIPRVLE